MPAAAPPPERVLLALVGSRDRPELAALDRLSAADWERIGGIAELHRLGPLLHSRHRDNVAVPAHWREAWARNYRASALRALAQRADLEDCCALLAANGFSPIALKGSFLARHAWPDPALRPMRDIDLLVPQDQVLAAYRLLLANGYAEASPSKLDLADHARLEQHMPALRMPRGSWLELHMRLSELDGKLEYRTPLGNEADVRARAITIEGLRYPDPNAMLAHVVTHAVYGHRFDCGPLLLGDVRHLVAGHAIDWERFWQTADRAGWAAGAALVLALVRDYHGDAAVPHDPREPAVSADTVDLARDLLVQNWRTSLFARFAAAFASGGFAYVRRRMTGRIAGAGEVGVEIDRRTEGGRLRWAWRQGAGFLRDIADPEIRRQARQLGRYRRWLNG